MICAGIIPTYGTFCRKRPSLRSPCRPGRNSCAAASATGSRSTSRRRMLQCTTRNSMAETFSFKVLANDGKARRGLVSMPRGEIRTPAFMPVGTGGTVKAMYMDQVRGVGADIILGNTYHLMLRPGAERVARLGGLHEFARWPHPILTDSGGFQVMSLSKLRKLTEQGVTFRSHID